MEVLKTTLFAGPNRWYSAPTAEWHLDADLPGKDRAATDRQLRAAWNEHLPQIRASADAAFRFLPRARPLVQQRLDQFATVLQRRTSPGLIVAHGVRAFQLACGVDVSFVAAQETDEPHVERIAAEYEESALAEACLSTAVEWCRAITAGEAVAVATDLRRLVDLADDVRLGPSSLAILRAALQQGIPFRRLGAGSLVQLGEGSRQRRIWTAETDATSAIAESIAQDKELTKRLLRQAGVPVPLGRAVTSPEDAWSAAHEIGLPVVVKPRKANHARGISLSVTTREEVEWAYTRAVTEGDDTGVIVEQYAPGQHHRLLVVGQRFVAGLRGESEYVVGDGEHTVAELVEIVNRDPRRGANYTDPLDILLLDDAALGELRRQNLTPESVPARGRRVLVQPVGDLTTDCTADVHPANAAHAVLAARIVGLDIAGMDVVADDIGRPLEDQRGAILEVNAGPSIGVHVAPLQGEPQPVGEAIVEVLFPRGANGRIPIMAVAGTGPRSQTAELIEQLMRRQGHMVGRAVQEGIWVDGRQIRDGRVTDAEKVTALVCHPEVDLIVWESRSDEAHECGLSCERVDVAIVGGVSANPSDTELGGLRAVAHAVPADGWLVLPLDCPQADELAAHCRGQVVYLAPVIEPERLARLRTDAQVLTVVQGGWLLTEANGERVIALDEFVAELSIDTHALSTLAAVAALFYLCSRT